MSTQNQSSTAPKREEGRHNASLKKQHADMAMSIVRKFVNPSLSIGLSDFRSLIFRTLHDAYIHKDGNSVVTDEEISTMYYLWDILDEIEYLIDVWGFPPEDEN